MAGSTYCNRFVLLLLVAMVSTKKDDCEIFFNTDRNSILFTELEEALVNNQSSFLNKLRHIFMHSESVNASFNIQIQVMNGSNLTQCNITDDCSFCPCPCESCPLSCNDSMWSLCYYYYISYRSQTFDSWQDKLERQSVDDLITWLSLLHGSLVALFVPIIYWNRDYFEPGQEYQLDLLFNIDTLEFNPYANETNCILSEIVSWIKVYAAGRIPDSPDPSQKGTTTEYYYGDFGDTPNGLNFIFKMTPATFVTLCLAEYIFVSLSLSLVIARFFPAVHNQIVSKVTRPEHQSLYWGTVIVSNIFTYGLLFLAMRGWAILFLFSFSFLYYTDIAVYFVNPLIPPIQEIVLHVILFIGALVATLKGHQISQYDVQIPNKATSTLIYITFCWSCFICCMCCSRGCRGKTMKVLVCFSLMSFVYRSIMDVISVAFMMFIEPYRTAVITLVLLYVSFLVFIILLSSLVFLNSIRSTATRVPCHRHFCKCLRDACGLTIIFPAVVLLVIVYTIVIMSLDLKGLTGIVIGLIPSVVLTAGSWYIKKRLLQNALAARNKKQNYEEHVSSSEEVEKPLLIP